MNKVAIYSPYIPKHFGGGERYLLSIAQIASWSAETTILVPKTMVDLTSSALAKYSTAFGIDLHRVRVCASAIGAGRNPIAIWNDTKHYDVLFAITDGSIFFSGAKRSYLIVQIPWMKGLSLLDRLKLLTWKSVLVYSDFVSRVLQKHWHIQKISVLSPYVDGRDFTLPSGKKEKLILSVGRFFSHSTSNSKRQDILIDAFASLVKNYHLKGWSLVLLGALEDQEYFRSLQERARGYSVIFAPNSTFDEVRSYYARASIYWHAAGYQVDEHKNPENTEHFGITTLEAMSSGCIPLVVPKGGQAEIVTDPSLHWQSIEELIAKTAACAQQFTKNSPEYIQLQSALRTRAGEYSKQQFDRCVVELL